LPTLAWLAWAPVICAIAWRLPRHPSAVVGLVWLSIALIVDARILWRLRDTVRARIVTFGPEGIEVRGLGKAKQVAWSELDNATLDDGAVHLLSRRAHVVLRYDADRAADARFIVEVAEYAAALVAAGRPVGIPWGAASPAREVAEEREPERGGDRSTRQIGALLIVAGLGAMLFGTYHLYSTREFVNRAHVYPGTVVKLVREWGNDGSLYRALIEFRPAPRDRRLFWSKTASSWADYVVGERVAVMYDPSHPSQEPRIRSFRELWAFEFIALGLGGILVCGGAAALIAERRAARRGARVVASLNNL
jgi:hypothetical protein